MAVKHLKSLVLHGSAVLLIGKAGNPHRVPGTTALPEAPEIDISMRRPSQGCKQEFLPAWQPKHGDPYRMGSWAILGAGRSLRCTGVLNHG
jgi:hypothetical protein